MPGLNRRDFLRLAALSVPAAVSSLSALRKSSDLQTARPNIVVLVLDAMSARNLSLYGYARNTTPNLDALAEHASVYHAHYAAGSFTPPGTASMLTGVYPWTHRAINPAGLVHPPFDQRNIFHWLMDDYYTEGFAQNYYANVFLAQFREAIDRHMPVNSFAFPADMALLEQHFPNDPVATYYALEKYGFTAARMPSAPLFELLYELGGGQHINRQPSASYPYGLPDNAVSRFENPAVYDGVLKEILALEGQGRPYFGYFHLFAPHEPYAPRKQFVGIFPDLDFPYKKPNRLSSLDIDRSGIMHQRKRYDEYIADVDHEVGRLVSALAREGVLQNTCLVITSDHGELFERGEYGHVTKFLYEGVIHIPLVILAPGQAARRDFHAPTSNVDLVPTLLTLAGKPLPDGLEGRLLPGFGGEEDWTRPVFSVEAKQCSSFGNLPRVTLALMKEEYKLIHYLGYGKVPDAFEFYNLWEDPDEMKDLFAVSPVQAARFRDELLATFEAKRVPGGKS
ncbi:MAG: sulfatase [Bacteroidota bacterium]